MKELEAESVTMVEEIKPQLAALEATPVIVAKADIQHQTAPQQRQRVKAAFFDIDETLIRGASAFMVTRELYRRNFFGIRDIMFASKEALLYLIFGEDKERVDTITQRALHVMAGHHVHEAEAVGKDVTRELVRHRIFPGTRKILEAHLAAGHEVWLLSATPKEIAVQIAEALGATGAVGTEIEIVDGVYRAELAAPFMHGPGKARVVRQLAMDRNLDLNESWAYSDSFNDLPMLLTVGKPRAINPDLKLRAFAMRNRWKIFDFRRFRRGIIETVLKQTGQAIGFSWIVSMAVRTLVKNRK